MNYRYIGRRIATFLLTIFIASTLNFALTRLTPQDPIAALLGRMASRGRSVENGAEITALFRERLGLDDSIPQQYLNYLLGLLRGDLGYSLAFFPIKAESVILRALPWTLGLLSVATLLAFTAGNLLGALATWPQVPRGFRWLVYLSMPFSAIPYYLLALILVYLLALNWSIFSPRWRLYGGQHARPGPRHLRRYGVSRDLARALGFFWRSSAFGPSACAASWPPCSGTIT